MFRFSHLQTIYVKTFLCDIIQALGLWR